MLTYKDRLASMRETKLRHTLEKREPSMGGEDFSFFSDCAPGAFFHIGCVLPEEMPAPALHAREFHLDERCLTVGALMHVALVLDGGASADAQ